MSIVQSLVITKGPKAGKSLSLHAGKTVGLGASGVRIGLEGAVVWVRGDLSGGGVLRNGEPVAEAHVLNPGDTLQVGDNVYTVRYAEQTTGFQRAQQALNRVRLLPTRKDSSMRYIALILESFALTSVALLFVTTLGTPVAGLFGLFLASASLTPRFQALLQENKDLIFVEKAGSWYANRLAALSIVMMFLGICLAFIGFAVLSPEKDLSKIFGLLYDTEGASLLTQQFGAFVPIFLHNLMVMGAIGTLCLVYRAYGALLTLGYNASVWVIVLSALTAGVPGMGEDPVQTAGIVGWSLLSIAPHLVLEGAAYVVIALAAIFYSKGFTRYMVPLTTHQPVSPASVVAAEQPKDNVFYDISVVCIKMGVAAVAILFVATAVEAFYADWMLAQMGAWLGAT